MPIAFPTTPIVSPLTGADENPLSESGTWRGPIRTGSNQLQKQASAAANPSSGPTTGEGYRLLGAYLNTEVYVTPFNFTTDLSFVGVVARAQNTGTPTADFYSVEWVFKTGATDSLDCYRVDNTVFNSLGSFGTLDFVDGMRMGLLVLGTGISVDLYCFIYQGGIWSQFGPTINDTSANRITVVGAIGLYIGSTINSDVLRARTFGGGEQGTLIQTNELRQVSGRSFQ